MTIKESYSKGKKGSKFLQMLAVRPGGADPSWILLGFGMFFTARPWERVFLDQSINSSSLGKDNGGRRFWRAVYAATEDCSCSAQWRGRGVLQSPKTNLWNWGHPTKPILGLSLKISLFFTHSIMELGGVCGNRGLLVRPMEGGRLGRSHSSGSSGGLQALEQHQHLSCIKHPCDKTTSYLEMAHRH